MAQDTLSFGAALAVGMIALACGLQLPVTTVVVGHISAQGVTVASGTVDYHDLNHLVKLKKTLLVLPLANLKYLLQKAGSADHGYEVVAEGTSDMRAVYAGTLKVGQWTGV